MDVALLIRRAKDHLPVKDHLPARDAADRHPDKITTDLDLADLDPAVLEALEVLEAHLAQALCTESLCLCVDPHPTVVRPLLPTISSTRTARCVALRVLQALEPRARRLTVVHLGVTTDQAPAVLLAVTTAVLLGVTTGQAPAVLLVVTTDQAQAVLRALTTDQAKAKALYAHTHPTAVRDRHPAASRGRCEARPGMVNGP